MTLGVYAAAMEWADGERERLRALVEGTKWQETGNNSTATALTVTEGHLMAEADLAS